MSGAILALDGAQPLQRELVGGKAYSLNQMRSLGLPVPPAGWRQKRGAGSADRTALCSCRSAPVRLRACQG